MATILQTFRKNRTLLITLAVLFLLFLMAVQGMSTRDWVVTLLRGLAVGSITFLVAAGLSIILGLMDVLNLAHGTLFMIGAYVGWSMYVRPDTMVDLSTPLLLVIAGFLLLPLWAVLLARLKLSRTVARLWPWLALVLGLGLAALGLSQAPVAIWSATDYQQSPIVWTQYAEAGTTAQQVQPATFAPGQSPVLVWGAILLGSVLTGLAIVGLIQARRGGAEGQARRPMGRTLASFAALVVAALAIFVVNTPLTNFFFGLNTTVLFVIAIAVAALVGAGLGGLMEATLIRPLYARAIYQIMLTFGLAFIGTEVVRAIWGRTGFIMPKPSLFASTGEGCPAQQHRRLAAVPLLHPGNRDRRPEGADPHLQRDLRHPGGPGGVDRRLAALAALAAGHGHPRRRAGQRHGRGVGHQRAPRLHPGVCVWAWGWPRWAV